MAQTIGNRESKCKQRVQVGSMWSLHALNFLQEDFCGIAIHCLAITILLYIINQTYVCTRRMSLASGLSLLIDCIKNYRVGSILHIKGCHPLFCYVGCYFN